MDNGNGKYEEHFGYLSSGFWHWFLKPCQEYMFLNSRTLKEIPHMSKHFKGKYCVFTFQIE